MNALKIIALTGIVASLSACGGGGGAGGTGGPGGGGGAQTLYPVANIDETTMENNLGVQDGIDRTMTGAVTRVGATDGRFTVHYGSENDEGDTTPPRMDASLNTPYGEITTPVVSQNAQESLIMNGQVVRAEPNAADVFYLPSTGSNMHVGMVRRVNNDFGAVGIFGNKTPGSDIATLHQNETVATYSGVAEVMVNDDAAQNTHGYSGTINATADFGNNSIAYNANNLSLNTNTGGAASMTLNGDAVVSGNGAINGSFSTTGAATTTGTTTGSFYGPNAANVGLIFVDPNADVAGGAILNQN